ncbi:hypothetical protein PGN61_20965 [Klebsiella aerogenes]
MAVQDYFNNSVGLPTQQDYQPNQFNSKGESLSPTPTGAPITVDVDNDNRTSQQWKGQALQATQDTLSVYDTSNKIVGSTGYLYEKIDDSRPTQARNAAMAFAEGYFSHMGDQGQAIAAGALGASQSVSNINGAIKRQSLITDLESKGYNPIDIDKWIQTGDTKDLITNKGSWTSDGKGFMHNTLTGEVKPIPGYQQPQIKPVQVNLGNRVAFVDPITGKEISSFETGLKPGSTGTTTGGGDIGLDEDEANADDTPEMENGLYGTRDKKTGNFKPLGQKEQEHWRQREQAKQGNTSASYQIENNDLDTIANASAKDLEGITGSFDQHLGLNNPVINLQSSNREVYAAAKKIEGLQGLSGVALAKAAGLSGINTDREYQSVAKAVAQLDRSSPENLIASVKRIKTDLQAIQDEHDRSLGVNKNNSTSHLNDDELLNKYLPKKGG